MSNAKKDPTNPEKISLPATFTTGYRRDLETARNIVRRRRNATTGDDREQAPRAYKKAS